MPATVTRGTLIKEMKLRLGDQMTDVELDPEHYDLAIDKALEKFYQRSSNSVEEKFVELEIVEDVTTYTLPAEISEVINIYRRGSGRGTTTGADIEPFEAQYLNSYLLQTGAIGGLALYDALAQHRELLARIFGAKVLFTWNHSTKKLLLHRRVRARDVVFLHAYVERAEDEILNDMYAKPWIKDYSLAMSKLMLAEARGKFASIVGPQGGTTLNGDKLSADAQVELDKLEKDLDDMITGESFMPIIIG